MYIFKPILEKNWENTAKMDAKRIASQTEPEGLEQILDIPYIDDGEKGHLLDVYYPQGTTKKLPVIIETFDNSNTQGTDAVSACVVFRKLKPSKKDYKKYIIKTVVGHDDYASMREALSRRFAHLSDEKTPQGVLCRQYRQKEKRWSRR